MEADWAVKIGTDLPVIDGSWEGFVDLQTSPQMIGMVAEAQHPALRTALLALNSASSLLWTTKCDAWTIADHEIDPDEFDASERHARVGLSSYIDILERDAARFISFEFHEQRVRDISTHLRSLALRDGRVDLVVRAASWKEQSGYGFTLYAAGCGTSESTAYAAWQAVLVAAVAATIAAAAHPPRMGE